MRCAAAQHDPLDPQTRALVNHRLTLNLLIQGVAVYHSIHGTPEAREQLEGFDERVSALNERVDVGTSIAQWRNELSPWGGMARRFWRRVRRRPGHPFHYHPVLRAHGGSLSREAYRAARGRARSLRVPTWPVGFSVWMMWSMLRLGFREYAERYELAWAATTAASRAWGVDPYRLSARVTDSVELPGVRTPRTFLGRLYRRCAVGWSGVVRDDRGRLVVDARGQTFCHLMHELHKGVAELVCLRGMAGWSEASYNAVMQETDHIEHEMPTMQAGAALWARLLAVLEPGHRVADYLAEIAALEPAALEALVFALVEDPAKARRLLGDVMDVYLA